MALSLCALIAFGGQAADAQRKRSGRIGEVALCGITLYDPGQKVLSKYGSPDRIEALSVGTAGDQGGGGGPSGGAGGARQGPNPGGGGGGGNGPSAPPGGLSMGDFIGDPFGATMDRQRGASAPPELEGGEGGGGGRTRSGPNPGGGGPTPGGGGGGGGAAGGSQSVQYTRWIYKRPSAQYAFVLDKYNKVVQIEAVGIRDSYVKTSRGVTFGMTFSQLMNKYFQPDGYDIAGDTMVVRFLQRGKVAFRLSRTTANQPQRITGIVIAAGKA